MGIVDPINLRVSTVETMFLRMVIRGHVECSALGCSDSEDQLFDKARGQHSSLGAPVLMVRVLDIIFPGLSCCFWSVRKFVIH